MNDHPPACSCGCGQLVRQRHHRFRHGHNARGATRSLPFASGYKIEDRGYSTPCWIWQRTTTKRDGQPRYGRCWSERLQRQDLAHRVSWELASGRPFPVGLQADHLCRVTLCVNPEHVEPVTPLENTRRGRLVKIPLAELQDAVVLCSVAEQYGVTRQTIYKIIRAQQARPGEERDR